jgi:hypothetical protein
MLYRSYSHRGELRVSLGDQLGDPRQRNGKKNGGGE